MHDHPGSVGPDLLTWFGPVLALMALTAYLVMIRSVRGVWSHRRTACWVGGLAVGVIGISGPWAESAQHSFVGHMITHLLVGMAAPLLLVLGAPVTLLLRGLPVPTARRASRMLRRLPVRVLTEPAVAALLNVGGLWLIYTTGVYPALHRTGWVYLLVHAHLLIAGWLFTAAVLAVDPMPHRRGFPHRVTVLVTALATHDVLAKHLYAHPPDGVGEAEAQLGSLIMYYGGDAVDLVLIVIGCAGWAHALRRDANRTRSPRPSPSRWWQPTGPR